MYLFKRTPFISFFFTQYTSEQIQIKLPIYVAFADQLCDHCYKFKNFNRLAYMLPKEPLEPF